MGRLEATRPWQHVLGPLWNHFKPAENILRGEVEALHLQFRAGALEANFSVRELLEAALGHRPGSWRGVS